MSQTKKVVSQKCIGYQKVYGSTNTVIQNIVELDNGEVEIHWQIHYSNGFFSLPLDKQPQIDIPFESSTTS